MNIIKNGPEDMVMSDELLGERIKTVRKQRSMTLQDLADRSGLSIGFISKVERGLTSPAFSALLGICRALQVDLVELVQASTDRRPVIRKNERMSMFPKADDGLRHEFGTQGFRKIKGLWLTLRPGAEDISRGHSEEELGIVIKGRLKVTLEKEPYILEEGDALYIDSYVPHSLKNIGNGECVCFFVFN
ncbi:cupin domain-containing protein [Desulfosporosinus sp. PR]|uniref:helix-turn-helix domain-containing protein n=1 Tax=Candidatus Desulfosporosinus nitrosoreducens TaxID=3401928 RepID=UPI0027EE5D1D|nr:cupin domain-containing protein [Desulfosporosinus sp. PR]MDQ7095139.1 cupin domain-containing protein [Desulfosporosinus sp. PR]